MKLPVLEDFFGGIPTGSAHDAAAGVRTRTTYIKVANWCSILCPSQDGPHEIQLLKRQFALKDVPFRQRKRAFDVERRQDLTMQDDVP